MEPVTKVSGRMAPLDRADHALDIWEFEDEDVLVDAYAVGSAFFEGAVRFDFMADFVAIERDGRWVEHHDRRFDSLVPAADKDRHRRSPLATVRQLHARQNDELQLAFICFANSRP